MTGSPPARTPASSTPARRDGGFRTDDGHWVPALLAAWERQPDHTWWGRVVIVENGTATEILTTATRLRPPS